MTDPSNVGFRASLHGATLFDLVQMECTRGTHGCVQVTSDGRVGYLYFDAGQIVHARCGSSLGESAVFTMLQWRSGDVTPVDRPWPVRATIDQSWQNVLLRAAQAQDEGQLEEPRGADVLPFVPGTRPPPAGHSESAHTKPTQDEWAPEADEGRSSGLHRAVAEFAESEREIDMPAAPETLASQREIHDLAAVDADGNVRVQKGNAELLSQTGAYVARLATLISDSLGLEPFQELHARVGHSQTAVRVDPDCIVALKASEHCDLKTFYRSGVV